jgi:hypothetical protein
MWGDRAPGGAAGLRWLWTPESPCYKSTSQTASDAPPALACCEEQCGASLLLGLLLGLDGGQQRDRSLLPGLLPGLVDGEQDSQLAASLRGGDSGRGQRGAGDSGCGHSCAGKAGSRAQGTRV